MLLIFPPLKRHTHTKKPVDITLNSAIFFSKYSFLSSEKNYTFSIFFIDLKGEKIWKWL